MGSKGRKKWIVPVLALTVDAEGLEALTNSGIVASVQDDAKVYPTLAESVPLIGGDVAWSAGYDGSGWTVALLDGPVDTTHPFLGGRVVDEACFVSDSSCPNGANEQTGHGSSVPRSGEDHGMHVAGIAAGRSSSFSGVAKGANIIAVKVLSTNGGTFSDVMKGLEYVGSGPLSTDGVPFEVVTNEEQVQADKVHVLGLGKREGLSDEPGQALSEGAVEALDMGCKASVFADSLVLRLRDDSLVSAPEVGIANALFVRFRNRTPQLLARCFTTSADDAGHDLPGVST